MKLKKCCGKKPKYYWSGIGCCDAVEIQCTKCKKTTGVISGYMEYPISEAEEIWNTLTEGEK